jgi:uncharacterized membrane protein
LGFALLACGVVGNPRVIGWLLAPDGSIDGEMRNWQIIAADVFCVVAAIALLSTKVRGWFTPVASNLFAGVLVTGGVTALLVAPAYGIWAYRTAHHHTHYVDNDRPPTQPEREWADEFVRRSMASAQRQGWFDLDKAKADGYERQWSDGEHWVNRRYLFDEAILDPERPEFLMYSESPDGQPPVLTGFMYYTRALEERGPTPAGNLAQWHYHPWPGRGYCAERGLLVVSRPDEDGRCPVGERVDRSAEMLHVWFVEHPLGPFADVMVFPRQKTMRDGKLLHPLVVHFGIALVLVSAVLDLAGRIARRPVLHSVAAANLFIGAGAMVAAVASGMYAEVQLVMGHDVHQVLDAHKLFAFSAAAGVAILTLWRLATRGQFPSRGGAAYLVIAVASATLTGLAGHRGAELVFVHGTAVQALDRFAIERYERSLFSGPGVSRPASATHHSQ